MNRSTVQPFRRNNVHWREQCFPLWLKFEQNFVDSSRTLINLGKVGTQAVQKTTGLNPDVIPIDQKRITLPIFSISNYITSPASAYFRGEHLVAIGASTATTIGPMSSASAGGDRLYVGEPTSFEVGDMILIASGEFNEEINTINDILPPAPDDGSIGLGDNLYYSHSIGETVDKVTETAISLGDSIAVSGSGTDVPNAHAFNFENDFTIEFDAKFHGIPVGEAEVCLFDWGNLSLKNKKGEFIINLPDNEQGNTRISYYDESFAYPDLEAGTDGNMATKFNHYAVVRRGEDINLFINGINYLQASAPEEITGDASDPYRNVRAIGSTTDGNHFFTGLIDDFKVWCEAIYGPEPFHCMKSADLACNAAPVASGICVIFDKFRFSSLRNKELLVEDVDPCWSEQVHVKCNQNPVLFVKVCPTIDPRYSPYVPMPYEVRWYKDGQFIASSKQSKVNSTAVLTGEKYIIGHYGLAELMIQNFAESDQGWYSAKVYYGPDPLRPIRIIELPDVKAVNLIYWCDSCFAGETRILLDNKKVKKLETLKVGDRVCGIDYDGFKEGLKWTPEGIVKTRVNKNGTEKLTNNTVKEVHESEVDEYYEVSYKTLILSVAPLSRTVKVSKNHPFYVGQGKYIPIKDLNVGDLIYTHVAARKCPKCPWEDKLVITPITGKKLIEEKLKVYNLSVDGSESYFAGNIAVHNKTPCIPTVTIEGCGAHCIGFNVELTARLCPEWCIRGPVTWVWSYQGISTITEGIEGGCYWSKIDLGIVGEPDINDIYVEVTDVLGNTYRAHGCDIVTYDCPPPTTTKTPTFTPTATVSRTPTPSISQTPTTTSTSTPSATGTGTGTISGTPTQTGTTTSSFTATSTKTFTATPTSTATSSATPTATASETATPTPTTSSTVTPSITDSVTATPTGTKGDLGACCMPSDTIQQFPDGTWGPSPPGCVENVTEEWCETYCGEGGCGTWMGAGSTCTNSVTGILNWDCTPITSTLTATPTPSLTVTMSGPWYCICDLFKQLYGATSTESANMIDLGTVTSCYDSLDALAANYTGGCTDQDIGHTYIFRCANECAIGTVWGGAAGYEWYATASALCHSAKHRFGNTDVPWSQRVFKLTLIGKKNIFAGSTQNGVATASWTGCYSSYTLEEITATGNLASRCLQSNVYPTALNGLLGDEEYVVEVHYDQQDCLNNCACPPTTTASGTRTATSTSSATTTPTASETATSTPSETATTSATPTATSTLSETATATESGTATSTRTGTFTSTLSSTATTTPTSTPTPSVTWPSCFPHEIGYYTKPKNTPRCIECSSGHYVGEPSTGDPIAEHEVSPLHYGDTVKVHVDYCPYYNYGVTTTYVDFYVNNILVRTFEKDAPSWASCVPVNVAHDEFVTASAGDKIVVKVRGAATIAGPGGTGIGWTPELIFNFYTNIEECLTPTRSATPTFSATHTITATASLPHCDEYPYYYFNIPQVGPCSSCNVGTWIQGAGTNGRTVAGDVFLNHTVSDYHTGPLYIDLKFCYNNWSQPGFCVNFYVNGVPRVGPDTNLPSGPSSSDTVLLIQSDTTDGDTNFNDSSPSQHPITAIGDVQHKTAEKKFGSSSIYFDGNDYLNIPNHSGTGNDWDFGAGDFTIEAWVYPTSYDQSQNDRQVGIVNAMHYGGANNWSGWEFGLIAESANSNGAWVEFYNADTAYLFRTSTAGGDVQKNEWSHIALVRDNGVLKALVNGIVIKSEQHNADLNADIDLSIGRYASDTAAAPLSNYNFKGYLDEIKISKTVMGSPFSPDNDTVLLIQSDTTGGDTDFKDSSPSQHKIIRVGDTEHKADEKKFGSSSIYFDGAGDHLFTDDHNDFNFGTDNFTIEFWFFPTATPSNYDMLLSKGASGSNAANASQADFEITFNSSRKIDVYRLTDTNYHGRYGYSQLELNKWHHVAIVREGNQMELYINGYREPTKSNTSNTYYSSWAKTNAIYNSTRPIQIGAQEYTVGSVTNYFDGYLDDIRISRAARYNSTGCFAGSFWYGGCGPQTIFTDLPFTAKPGDVITATAGQNTHYFNFQSVVKECHRSVSITDTATGTLTATPTVSFGTPTYTRSMSLTPTLSESLTPTISATPTLSAPFTHSLSQTPTGTLSSTPTMSDTATATRSALPTLTITLTPTTTITETITPTDSATPTLSESLTPTISATPTLSASLTPTQTLSSTPTISATPSATSTVISDCDYTITVTLQQARLPTPTFTASSSSSVTVTPYFILGTSTATMTASVSPSSSQSSTVTPTATATPSVTHPCTERMDLGLKSYEGCTNSTPVENNYVEGAAELDNPHRTASWDRFTAGGTMVLEKTEDELAISNNEWRDTIITQEEHHFNDKRKFKAYFWDDNCVSDTTISASSIKIKNHHPTQTINVTWGIGLEHRNHPFTGIVMIQPGETYEETGWAEIVAEQILLGIKQVSGSGSEPQTCPPADGLEFIVDGCPSCGTWTATMSATPTLTTSSSASATPTASHSVTPTTTPTLTPTATLTLTPTHTYDPCEDAMGACCWEQEAEIWIIVGQVPYKTRGGTGNWGCINTTYAKCGAYPQSPGVWRTAFQGEDTECTGACKLIWVKPPACITPTVSATVTPSSTLTSTATPSVTLTPTASHVEICNCGPGAPAGCQPTLNTPSSGIYISFATQGDLVENVAIGDCLFYTIPHDHAPTYYHKVIDVITQGAKVMVKVDPATPVIIPGGTSVCLCPATPTPSGTLQLTSTATSPATPTGTATIELTPTGTATVQLTATDTATQTATGTATQTTTGTITQTATTTSTATLTTTITLTTTLTITPTATPTLTKTVIPTLTATEPYITATESSCLPTGCTQSFPPFAHPNGTGCVRMVALGCDGAMATSTWTNISTVSFRQATASEVSAVCGAVGMNNCCCQGYLIPVLNGQDWWYNAQAAAHGVGWASGPMCMVSVESCDTSTATSTEPYETVPTISCPAYPSLQCPRVSAVSPRYSTGDLIVTRGLRGSYTSWRSPYRQWQIHYQIINDQTSINLALSVSASDPNPAIKETGGLEYHWYTPSLGEVWYSGGSSRVFTFTHNTNSYVYCRISYKNYGNGKDPKPCPETKYTYVIFYVNFPKCNPPTVSYGCPDYWARRNGNACTAATVSVSGCKKDYQLIYQFYGNKSTYPGQNSMGRYRNIGYTNSIQVTGIYKSLSYQYSGNYWSRPDKLIITKDIYAGNNGDVIDVNFVGDCGTANLKTTISVPAGPSVTVSSWSGTSATFWKYSQCYWNYWTGQITYSYYYRPTYWNGYFNIYPRYGQSCTYYRILKDGQPLTGYSPLAGYAYIYYSGSGFQIYGNRILVYADRAAFPNDTHTITLEIYSNLQSEGNFNGASKSSVTWTVNFVDVPTYSSPGRINLRTGYRSGCGGWWGPWYYPYWNYYYYYYYPYYRWYYYPYRFTVPTYYRMNLRSNIYRYY